MNLKSVERIESKEIDQNEENLSRNVEILYELKRVILWATCKIN